MTRETPTNSELLRENRTLQWKNRQLGKQLGKAGRTIFRLRNEVAALRQAIQVKPGDYERLFASSRELRETNRRLREKLAAIEGAEKVQVGDNLYAQTPAQAEAIQKFIETGE